MVKIGGLLFKESEFERALELVRRENPVLADAIEGAATYTEDDDD